MSGFYCCAIDLRGFVGLDAFRLFWVPDWSAGSEAACFLITSHTQTPDTRYILDLEAVLVVFRFAGFWPCIRNKLTMNNGQPRKG